jgi:hypothetical protein
MKNDGDQGMLKRRFSSDFPRQDFRMAHATAETFQSRQRLETLLTDGMNLKTAFVPSNDNAFGAA